MQLLNAISNSRFWNKHSILLAWAIAALLLLIVTTRIGWISYSQSKIKASNYQPQDLRPLSKPEKRSNLGKEIMGANLFGNPNPPKVVVKAPKTTLNLKLQGILSATNPAMARAIIQGGKSKTAELYSVGDSIKGAGASIKEIRENEVLLNRNGATESLPLVKSKSSGKGGDIITYSDNNSTAFQDDNESKFASAASANRDVREIKTAATDSFQRQRAQNGAPRKVRKPNFSGLDRALKKRGEL